MKDKHLILEIAIMTIVVIVTVFSILMKEKLTPYYNGICDGFIYPSLLFNFIRLFYKEK